MRAVCATGLALAIVLSIHHERSLARVEPLTFARDIAPIFYANCTNCHRPGQIAPMSLLTYKDVRPWARAIKREVTARQMPPWFAEGPQGEFLHDPRLNADDIARISQWVDEGAVEGNVADLPPPPRHADGWRVGTPDLVVKMPKPFDVPAQGLVNYQYIDVPTGLTEDRWIQAIEIKPGDPRVVHHLRVFARAPKVDPPATSPVPGKTCNGEVCGNLEPPVSAWGTNIGSIAVGTQPDIFPVGTAKRLRAGSILMLHIHYTTMGVATKDQTSIGFVFAKQPPKVELKTVSLAQENFVIPPQAAAHPVEGRVQFQEDGAIWSLGPHNHFRGKSWRFELIDPDGTRRTILSVPRFDFHWQLNYVFRNPVAVKRGTQLVATNVFDNSAKNPVNPNPNVAVRWGEQSTDEMMFASVVYSVAPTTSRR
jgi:hypothetical protein